MRARGSEREHEVGAGTSSPCYEGCAGVLADRKDMAVEIGGGGSKLEDGGYGSDAARARVATAPLRDRREGFGGQGRAFIGLANLGTRAPGRDRAVAGAPRVMREVGNDPSSLMHGARA